MFTTPNRKKARALMAAATLTVAGLAASTALTAANTVPASKAGDGAGAITGYVVSAITYDLNTVNPQLIDSVSFTLDAAAPATSEVTVRLVSTSATWYPCTAAATAVTCTTTGAAVLTADELRVVAVD